MGLGGWELVILVTTPEPGEGRRMQVYQENCVEKTTLKGLEHSTKTHNQPIENPQEGVPPHGLNPAHNERAREIMDAIPKGQVLAIEKGRE